MAQNSNSIPGVARKRRERHRDGGEMQRCDDKTSSEDGFEFLEYSRARGSPMHMDHGQGRRVLVHRSSDGGDGFRSRARRDRGEMVRS